MSKRIWHKGPPPHVGWWNASTHRFNNFWRWWDGKCWSIAVIDTQSAQSAFIDSYVKNRLQDEIKWTTYYPKNARVLRIDPKSTK